MASKFFSLSHQLELVGHPVAAQGRDGGPSVVRSVAIIYDRNRSLFQAVFFEDGLDTQQLEKDVTRAGYLLFTVLPLPPVDDPDPDDDQVMRELRTRTSATSTRTAKVRLADAAKGSTATRKPRQDAKAKAEEAVELLRQLMVL